MKIVKKIGVVFCILLATCVVLLGSYVGYVMIQYHRIEDNKVLEIDRNATEVIKMNKTYSLLTYNIGFGAYDHDFSFFMDSGTMLDGTKVTGKNSKAKSKDVVLKNTNGVVGFLETQQPDFILLQEVDSSSTRSHHVNQKEMISAAFNLYDSSYAVNFDSAFLAYPLNDFHGKSLSGLLTLSKYQIDSSIRRSLPVDNSFPTKFFDLDRAFSVQRFPINNKEFVLVNMHMSAYDQGGKIREKQLKMVNDFLADEKIKGNYVIIGGDYNHTLLETSFPTQQKRPDWVFDLRNENLTEGYHIVSSDNAPTCRSTDLPYTKGVNYSVVLDGFIFSDNIKVESITNIDLDFEYSDHNPAKVEFSFVA